MDRRHIRQREEAVIDAQIDRFQRVFRGELPTHTDGDALRPGGHEAGLRHRILRLQRGDDRLAIDAERCDLAGGKFQIDRLVLRPDNIDLADILDGQDLGARIFDEIAQLALRQPVTGKGKNVAEHITEAIVEERTLHAGGKLALDIADHVANATPGRLHIPRLGGGQKFEEDGGLAGGRFAAGIIERFQFLQLLLDTVRHLTADLFRRRTRPGGRDHHRLDGEVRIFFAPEIEIGKHARNQEDDHEIGDERAVRQCPFGEIELFHCTRS